MRTAFGYGFKSREAEHIACSQAERIIDALGFQLHATEAAQAEHARKAKLEGRLAMTPGIDCKPVNPTKAMPLPALHTHGHTQCKLCRRVYKAPYDLDLHMQNHHGTQGVHMDELEEMRYGDESEGGKWHLVFNPRHRELISPNVGNAFTTTKDNQGAWRLQNLFNFYHKDMPTSTRMNRVRSLLEMEIDLPFFGSARRKVYGKGSSPQGRGRKAHGYHAC